jgi:hypothetical protein
MGGGRLSVQAPTARHIVTYQNREHAGNRTRQVAGAKEFTMKRSVPGRYLTPAACLLALGACGVNSLLVNPVSAADVAALEEGVIIADTLALDYTRLPSCPTATPACSVAATKQKIKLNAQRAHDAVKTLQAASSAGAPEAFAAAQAALSALRVSIPATTHAN